MCVAVVIAVILLPLFGGGFGYARYGAVGGWVGALAGLALALLLTGVPTAVFLLAEKKKFDSERLPGSKG